MTLRSSDSKPLPGYAELHCISNFSFLRGASHPQELVERAHELGYEALALTDECSVAGMVRGYLRARELGLHLLAGAEFALPQGRVIAIARNLQGWGNLCEFISQARQAAPKGSYQICWDSNPWARLGECEIIFAPSRAVTDLAAAGLLLHQARAGLVPGCLWLGVELVHEAADDLWLAQLEQLGAETGVPLVAAGDVHMHLRSRKALQDVLTATRLGRPVADCGHSLQPNAERRLRMRSQLAGLYPQPLLDATLEVARRCRFQLSEVAYNYPRESVPPGFTPAQALLHLTRQGAARRYPGGIPPRIQQYLDDELRLIAECNYEMFFLTVEDIVREARRLGILCQGRGSAANSVVCWCLGITAADPEVSHPLLARFISASRKNEPPDIDVDFEHERREEIIQYIYKKYGRDRAAIAAVVIRYRMRSAIRDVGKALDVPEALIDAFAKEHYWFDDDLAVQRLGELAQGLGLAMPPHVTALWLELVGTLTGFPRHLSQHVGGFVLTQDKLTRLVPVENAAMPDRSVIQWDKDDLERLGLMKVDVLALGMLTAIRRCLDFVSARRGYTFTRGHIPPEDQATYNMICKADTVGVFQIESRAQMSMLPRLKPKVFYDLVVEVAIVRPGPIAGGMVHPYLKARARRDKGEVIEYERSMLESPDGRPWLQDTLERTLGIPIFQEQVMQISMVAAGFSGEEADELRRGMAAWKRTGDMECFRSKLITGMLRKGYQPQFADRIFEQVKGFADYGFPESHAYSFALLAYESSWLKCHEPECFLAAMLNSQPMGFYPPSQLIQDAVRHGVQVLPPDVSHSDWDCTLHQSGSDSNCFVRLGLRLVGSLSAGAGERIAAARRQAAFTSTEDLSLRAQLDVRDLNALASGDALKSLSGHRRQQVWDAAARHRAPALLRGAPVNEEALQLDAAPEGEEIVFDYASLGLTLRRHPLALLRERLARKGFLNATQLGALPHGRTVSACGIVTVRQQPQTAKGTIFVTLEDETGPVNVIVWKHVREAQRDALLRSRLLAVRGTWQRDVDSGGLVCHLVAARLIDLTPLLGRLAQQSSTSRDFH